MPVVVHVRVVDGFFVQFIEGVDVPVLMQRRQYWIVRYLWGEFCDGWVTFAWRLALSMLRVCVRGLPCQFLDKALTMSSGSFVAAKVHVKVSIGSCAILWENTVTVGLRSRGGALYVESQCFLAVVQNCCSPCIFHRCSSWVRGVMPVVV